MTMQEIRSEIKNNIDNKQKTRIIFVSSNNPEEEIGTLTFDKNGIKAISANDEFLNLINKISYQNEYTQSDGVISISQVELRYKYTMDYLTQYLINLKGVIASNVEGVE